MLPGSFESDGSSDYSAGDGLPVSQEQEAEGGEAYSASSPEGNRVPAELGNQPKSESLKKYWHKVLAPGSKDKHTFSYEPPKETRSEIGKKEYWQELRRRDPIWRRGRILCAAVFFVMLGIGAVLWNYRSVGEIIAQSYEPPLVVALPGKLSCHETEFVAKDLVPLNSKISSNSCDTGALRFRNGGTVRFDRNTAAKVIHLEDVDDIMYSTVRLESGRICVSSLPKSVVHCESQIAILDPDLSQETEYIFSLSADGSGKPYAVTQVVKGQVTVSNIRGKLVKINLKAGDSLKSYAGNLGQALPFEPDAWVFWNTTWTDPASVAWPAYKPAADDSEEDSGAGGAEKAKDAKAAPSDSEKTGDAGAKAGGKSAESGDNAGNGAKNSAEDK